MIDYEQSREITDGLESALLKVKGVSAIDKSGYLDSEIQIKVNPDMLDKYNMSINEVISAISSRNARFTVGDNNQQDLEKNIVILSEFESVDDIKNVVIKSSFDGPVIRLIDIAEVFRGEEEETSITRVNGTKGFIFGIKKPSKEDIIKKAKRFKNGVPKLKKNYPMEINIFFIDNSSMPFENRMNII